MRPLEGTLVVDFSRVLAGPLCTQRLADLGARVIKVESPDGDATRRFGPPFVDGVSPYYLAYNRGKEAVTVDLRTDEGQEVARGLIARADVLVENFRPGRMRGFGLGPERLRELRPDLIHLTISGFGGGDERPAFDLVIQAESGLMAMTGDDEPVRCPISLADVAAGQTAAEAILAALFRRARHGVGATLEVNLLDALLALMGYQAQTTLLTGESPRPMGHRHPNLVPYQAFRGSDGWFVLGVATDRQWSRLVATDPLATSPQLSAKEWQTNPGRVEGRERLVPLLERIFSQDTVENWMERFRGGGIPAGRVRVLGDVLRERHRGWEGIVSEVEHASLGRIPVLTSAILCDGGRWECAGAPPVPGQHHADLLAEFVEGPTE